MTSRSFTPKLSDMTTVRCDGCDVTAASPRVVSDVIRSPLPVCASAQDGGTGSERRRRFPKMGRSCLLESLRQRGDSIEANSASATPPGSHFRASLSPDNAVMSPSTGCACATDLHHSAVTSWTRDLSHLPILRDTTV